MKLTRIVASLIMLTLGVATAQDFRDNAPLEMQFTTVRGIVTDESGRPVEGVRVGIREADIHPGAVPNSEDFGAWGIDAIPAETFADPSRDHEIFAWDFTDAKGRYALTGVPRPGAYMVIIRLAEGYRRVDAPISVATTVGPSFKVDLVLRASVGAAPSTQVKVQGMVALALEAEQGGDRNAAMLQMEELKELAPESPVPRFHLARLAAMDGDFMRAAGEIVSACELDPGCGPCWLLRAQVARETDNATEALEASEKAVQLLPTSAAAHAIRGEELYEAQQYGEALTSLETAVALGATDPNVFVYRANCYVAGRRFDDASSAYRDFLGRFPDAPNREQVKQILRQLETMAGN